MQKTGELASIYSSFVGGNILAKCSICIPVMVVCLDSETAARWVRIFRDGSGKSVPCAHAPREEEGSISFGCWSMESEHGRSRLGGISRQSAPREHATRSTTRARRRRRHILCRGWKSGWTFLASSPGACPHTWTLLTIVQLLVLSTSLCLCSFGWLGTLSPSHEKRSRD